MNGGSRPRLSDEYPQSLPAYPPSSSRVRSLGLANGSEAEDSPPPAPEAEPQSEALSRARLASGLEVGSSSEGASSGGGGRGRPPAWGGGASGRAARGPRPRDCVDMSKWAPAPATVLSAEVRRRPVPGAARGVEPGLNAVSGVAGTDEAAAAAASSSLCLLNWYGVVGELRREIHPWDIGPNTIVRMIIKTCITMSLNRKSICSCSHASLGLLGNGPQCLQSALEFTLQPRASGTRHGSWSAPPPSPGPCPVPSGGRLWTGCPTAGSHLEVRYKSG